jgi:hypothetical protein
MLRQRLAIAAAAPNLIPTPPAHTPLDWSTRQIAGRPEFRPLDNTPSHSSNPHRSRRRRRNRAPSGPRFRALALLGRLSSERVDSLVMQASEKPAQKQTQDSHIAASKREAMTNNSNRVHSIEFIRPELVDTTPGQVRSSGFFRSDARDVGRRGKADRP